MLAQNCPQQHPQNMDASVDIAVKWALDVLCKSVLKARWACWGETHSIFFILHPFE